MWGSIISAGIGAVSSALGARSANKEARKAAQTQMNFQQRMRATQYQTAMADMKAAGLNPILAYKQGGAGTPGGSSYTPVNIGAAAAQGGGIGGSTATGVTAAETQKREADTKAGKLTLEEKIGHQQIENLAADTALKRSDDQYKKELTRSEYHRGTAAFESGQLARQQWKKLGAEMLILQEELQSAKSRASADRIAQKFFESDAGKVFKKIDLMGRSINPFANSAKAVK